MAAVSAGTLPRRLGLESSSSLLVDARFRSSVVSSGCGTRKIPGFFSFPVCASNPPSNPARLTIFLNGIATAWFSL